MTKGEAIRDLVRLYFQGRHHSLFQLCKLKEMMSVNHWNNVWNEKAKLNEQDDSRLNHVVAFQMKEQLGVYHEAFASDDFYTGEDMPAIRRLASAWYFEYATGCKLEFTEDSFKIVDDGKTVFERSF